MLQIKVLPLLVGIFVSFILLLYLCVGVLESEFTLYIIMDKIYIIIVSKVINNNAMVLTEFKLGGYIANTEDLIKFIPSESKHLLNNSYLYNIISMTLF